MIESFPNFFDESPETCDEVSKGTFLNVVWELTGKTKSIKATVIIKGSQLCNMGNTAWFISGRVPGPMVMGCDVTEEQDADLRRCNLLCQCACEEVCGFLHFRVQIPQWMKKNLSLCHYEEYNLVPWLLTHSLESIVKLNKAYIYIYMIT